MRKNLFLKGLKEETLTYRVTELFKKFPERQAFKKHFRVLDIRRVELNVLGNWVYDEMFGILIDINWLRYPNRSLKVRLRENYAQELFKCFESNK